MTDEMRKLIDQEKVREITACLREDEEAPPKQSSTPAKADVSKIVDAQRAKDLEDISKNEKFTTMSTEITAREAYNELKKKDNEIKDEELKREWEEYLLKKKKEEQDYRTALEKDLIKQEVKADVYAKKREISIKRYGYLYQKAEDGSLKDFSPSKVLNRYKELARWYQSLTDPTRKIINTTTKLLLRIGIIVAIGFALYGIIKWIVSSGIIIIG